MNKVSIIRSSIFIGLLVIFFIAQLIIPSRQPKKDRWQFTVSNLVLVFMNNGIIMLIPLIPYGIALWAEENTFGVFNRILLPNWLEIIVAVLLLDLVIYFQHRLFHTSNILWRLHRMHHSDPLVDTTTALRFHPFEIIISNFIKVGTIILLGVSPITVIIFEIGLNSLAMFNHTNIRIADKYEQYIRLILITPALHTIHHSKIKAETQSNYGFSVPWWDHIFGTYLGKGTKVQNQIKIGIVDITDDKYSKLPWMLVHPFV